MANSLPIPKDYILGQIKDEVNYSYSYVRNKREQFRDRLKLYNNQKKDKSKVGITILYTIINTLLSTYFNDRLSIKFMPRTLGDRGLTDNLNMLASFDYDEMGLDSINYTTQWDRLFFGVGIRGLIGFDENRFVPILKTLDPLSWLPDPEGGINNKFRWQGFNIFSSIRGMENDKDFFNINELKRGDKDMESQDNKEAYNDASGLNSNNEEDTDIISVINHYTFLKGKPYMVTVANNIKTIIRIKEIKPVGKVEEKDPSLIELPISLNYYSPERNNVFGISVPDLVEDKQRAISIISNLRLLKEKAELYPMYLFNTQKIKNRSDLNFGFNKLIGVNGPVDQGIIQPMQKDFNKGTSYHVEQNIDKEAQISTGASTIQQGALSDQAKTLGEVQQVQSNANLRFSLGNKINSIGEKQFRKLWYREYKGNFKGSMKKIIRINNGFGVMPRFLKRNDFITLEDPDVDVESFNISEQKRERDRINFASVLPFLLQDPNINEISKNYSKREMLRLGGMKTEKINVLVPQTVDELEAIEENELIKNDVMPKALLEEDHLTHIFMHQQEEYNNTNRIHQGTHMDLYKQKSKQLDQQQQQLLSEEQGVTQMNQASNIAQSQIGNQASNLQSKNKPI